MVLQGSGRICGHGSRARLIFSFKPDRPTTSPPRWKRDTGAVLAAKSGPRQDRLGRLQWKGGGAGGTLPFEFSFLTACQLVSRRSYTLVHITCDRLTDLPHRWSKTSNSARCSLCLTSGSMRTISVPIRCNRPHGAILTTIIQATFGPLYVRARMATRRFVSSQIA